MGGVYIFPMPCKHSNINLLYRLQAIIYYLSTLLSPAMLIYGLYYWIPSTGCHSIERNLNWLHSKKHTMLLVALETQTIFLGKTYSEFFTLFLEMSTIFSLNLCLAQYFIPCTFRSVTIYFPGHKKIYIVMNIDTIYICPGQATSFVSTEYSIPDTEDGKVLRTKRLQKLH